MKNIIKIPQRKKNTNTDINFLLVTLKLAYNEYNITDPFIKFRMEMRKFIGVLKRRRYTSNKNANHVEIMLIISDYNSSQSQLQPIRRKIRTIIQLFELI